jgi:DNA polymerase-1
MPGPLLAVDAPSLLYRAFYALPKTITDDKGMPVNALLGVSNLVRQAVERYEPRAVVLCFGEEAAHYRVELYPTYHADRIDMPEELVPQWSDAAVLRRVRLDRLRHETLEADDLLGGLAEAETAAGGQALLFTGDRDMFQCVSDDVTVLWPAGKGETEPIGPAEVRRRYGVRPDQVPDFIALRGDPSDGLPGAKGIGEKTARELLNEHDTSTRCWRPMSLRPRVRNADRPGRRAAGVPARSRRSSRRRRAPARRADRLRRAARGGARALDEPTCGATRCVGGGLTGNPGPNPTGGGSPMFGRFRKTNDPDRETDGGAVAVDVGRRAGDQRRHAGGRPGRRERRPGRAARDQAGDADTRGPIASAPSGRPHDRDERGRADRVASATASRASAPARER